MRQDYLKNRRTLKIIDTIIAGVAILNGILSYIENEYFRMEIVEDGIIIKNEFESSTNETNLRFITILFVLLLGNMDS